MLETTSLRSNVINAGLPARPRRVRERCTVYEIISVRSRGCVGGVAAHLVAPDARCTLNPLDSGQSADARDRIQSDHHRFTRVLSTGRLTAAQQLVRPSVGICVFKWIARPASV